ncbi:hypothetical protein BDW68DRAFT_98259 [Aspergillus falconensis]
MLIHKHAYSQLSVGPHKRSAGVPWLMAQGQFFSGGSRLDPCHDPEPEPHCQDCVNPGTRTVCVDDWTGETGNGQLACNAVGMIRPLGWRDRQDSIRSPVTPSSRIVSTPKVLTSSSRVRTELASPHLPRSWPEPRFGPLQTDCWIQGARP